MNIIRDYIENFYARSILENQPPEPLLNKEGEVIDSKKLVVNLYVKPSTTTEYIELVTTITKSGISFSEVIG